MSRTDTVVASEIGVTPEPVDGRLIEQLSRDVLESLSLLGKSAELLLQVDEAAHAANVVTFLEAIGLRAAQFDERVARLAPFAAALLADVADDIADAAETLATRWDGLVASRRRTLAEGLLTRQRELADLVAALARPATVAQSASSASPVHPPPRPPAALSAKDAGKAWDAWNLDPSRAAADVFLRLSQSWIEGTGAQLARDERSPSSAPSNATEVMARIRHHLGLLAASAPIPYMVALTTARRRVVEELRSAGRPTKRGRSAPRSVRPSRPD